MLQQSNLSPPASLPHFVKLGKIVRPHGVRGEVLVRSWTTAPEDITRYSAFTLQGSGDQQETIAVARWTQRGDRLYAKLAGHDTPEAVRPLCQLEMCVDRDEISIDADEYLWADLVGMQVMFVDGSSAGTVRSLFDAPAHPVMVVKTQDGSDLLVPWVPAHIASVDAEARVIRLAIL